MKTSRFSREVLSASYFVVSRASASRPDNESKYEYQDYGKQEYADGACGNHGSTCVDAGRDSGRAVGLRGPAVLTGSREHVAERSCTRFGTILRVSASRPL